MSGFLSIILILVLITLSTINLKIMIVHADLPYCVTGQGKNGVSVKICSVDKQKCEENAKEHDISSSCKRTD